MNNKFKSLVLVGIALLNVAAVSMQEFKEENDQGWILVKNGDTVVNRTDAMWMDCALQIGPETTITLPGQVVKVTHEWATLKGVTVLLRPGQAATFNGMSWESMCTMSHSPQFEVAWPIMKYQLFMPFVAKGE